MLKPTGRLGVISMSRGYGEPMLLRLYQWAHKKWPRYVDCRPIYVEGALKTAGFKIQSKQMVRLMGLPGEVIIATKSE